MKSNSIFKIFVAVCLVGLSANRVNAQLSDNVFVGKIKPLSAKEIKSSKLSIGFETLDRKLFDPERCYERMGALGVKWARCQTGWNRCETAKGVYDFKWLDEVVDEFLKRGIQPWFNLGYGNALYTPGAVNNMAVGWAPDNSDEARAAWVNFVKALTTHFKGRVKHFEIWNESNIVVFWKPTAPTPELYTNLVMRSSKAIREANPDAIIIGGAFAGIPTDFFRKCMELGMGNYIDKVSYHPYFIIPEKDYAKDMDEWKSIINKHKPGLELWQGECGCPSDENGVGALCELKWNESRQARWLLRRTVNDLRHGVELVSWYNVVDQGGYGKAVYEPNAKTNAYFGLLRMQTYTPKPSYYAYQNFCSIFSNDITTSEKTEMSFKSDETIDWTGFEKGKYPVCTYWMPTDVQDDILSRKTGIAISLKQGLKLTKPVLVDLLSGEVFALKGTFANNTWTFENVILHDYPMIITDIKAISLLR